MQNIMGDFKLDGHMMRYSLFVPRLYNLCKSYGFEPGRIMPSRAFCSDESQGFPIILIAKHFGAFPFNHGLVGGIMATDRHGPHAHHGKDLVIIQASHVGYDPETGEFGVYRRLQTDPTTHTTSCGKICAVTDWYLQEYQVARSNVSFTLMDGEAVVVIDNQFLDTGREEGLFLALDQILANEKASRPEPVSVLSTTKVFRVHPNFKNRLPDSFWQTDQRVAIGEQLTADLFSYRRTISSTIEGRDQLEQNLSGRMPRIVTAPYPALAAAQTNIQIEFDRAYRTLLREPEYRGKNLAFIAGINIDISPQEGQLFPLTKFVPWAAYIQTQGGKQFTLEQDELFAALESQSATNPDRIEMSNAIHIMEQTPEIKIVLPAR